LESEPEGEHEYDASLYYRATKRGAVLCGVCGSAGRIHSAGTKLGAENEREDELDYKEKTAPYRMLLRQKCCYTNALRLDRTEMAGGTGKVDGCVRARELIALCLHQVEQ